VTDGSLFGHSLRDGSAQRAAQGTPRRILRAPIVIVGGGIAGLSAGWWLRRHGMHDFVLLEAGPEAGGNARGGENEVSRFPWAAHYVPVPDQSMGHMRAMFTELGVLDANGVWSDRALCFAPRERVFVHGRWESGLEGAVASTPAERAELEQFDSLIAEQRATGQFTLPLAAGAPSSSPLDQVTFAEWLRDHGFRSRALHWYADYATRDDFGGRADECSAWAGVHYFAARAPSTTDPAGPLTWPEGTAWIARRLATGLGDRVRTNEPVVRVSSGRREVRVRTLAGDEWITDRVIYAAPTFTAPLVVEGAQVPAMPYSPWFTANLTLDREPADAGAPPAWDNVIAASASLGYVRATHQSLRAVDGPAVWTYYHAIGGNPIAGRQWLRAQTWRALADQIIVDLQRGHPDIREHVRRIDILRMGHAMPRPVPGTLARVAELAKPARNTRVLYANSDLSGLSLFEEAQDRGIRAARRAMEV